MLLLLENIQGIEVKYV